MYTQSVEISIPQDIKGNLDFKAGFTVAGKTASF